ncbi:MAG: hypothetical protein HY611_01065 [Elusimicrobia bacterium]|nr:hypothetical protein [Elusimicrobiota bacterium]
MNQTSKYANTIFRRLRLFALSLLCACVGSVSIASAAGGRARVAGTRGASSLSRAQRLQFRSIVRNLNSSRPATPAAVRERERLAQIYLQIESGASAAKNLPRPSRADADSARAYGALQNLLFKSSTEQEAFLKKQGLASADVKNAMETLGALSNYFDGADASQLARAVDASVSTRRPAAKNKPRSNSRRSMDIDLSSLEPSVAITHASDGSVEVQSRLDDWLINFYHQPQEEGAESKGFVMERRMTTSELGLLRQALEKSAPGPYPLDALKSKAAQTLPRQADYESRNNRLWMHTLDFSGFKPLRAVEENWGTVVDGVVGRIPVSLHFFDGRLPGFDLKILVRKTMSRKEMLQLKAALARRAMDPNSPLLKHYGVALRTLENFLAGGNPRP